LKQNTQHLSWLLVRIPLLKRASLVGSFSSNNRQPKMLTFDGTLFNQTDFNALTVAVSNSGNSKLCSRDL
jgi:hypothetical protein